jgi:hypothetical protein
MRTFCKRYADILNRRCAGGLQRMRKAGLQYLWRCPMARPAEEAKNNAFTAFGFPMLAVSSLRGVSENKLLS